MSKTGNAIIRDADAASLDNAAEVERLRAEVAGLAATAAGLSQQIAEARAALSPIGEGSLADAANHLKKNGRPLLALAVGETARRVVKARAILVVDPGNWTIG